MIACLSILRKIFATIDNEVILQQFHKIQTRRMQLPPLSRMPRMSGISIGRGSISSSNVQK